MNHTLQFFLAQAAEPAPQGGSFNFLIVMLLMMAGMYVLIIMPQQKKQKKLKEMINSLESGAEVVTIGGVYGVITNVKEKTFIVKIADNTKIEILKSAIQGRAVEQPAAPAEQKK